MDTNLKDNIDINEEICETKEIQDTNTGSALNIIASTTWGTLLTMLFLTAVSVFIYEPVKVFLFRNFNGFSVHEQLSRCIILIFAIGGVSILLLSIIAFALPYSLQKKASIIAVSNKIYVEFKLFFWVMFFLGLFCIVNFIGMDLTYSIIHANWLFYLIGIPATFILYNLIYYSIVYVKHIYHTGFVSSFIKNSIIGRLFFYTANFIKKTAEGMIEIDTANETHKKLLILLGINLAAIILISFSFPLGSILAIVYTAYLYNCLIKLLERARVLNEASSVLAGGSFDIVLPEDFGLLNSYAKNLNNVKEGFKTAVLEEVKSQNMKTELISSVSHDLKTPLTSIITYVDLLKNENLDNETRKEYLDVLDKKSRRLKVLIEDLFEASSASSGNIELHLEKLDVIALLRQTLGELEEKINESTLQMKVSLPEDKVLCELDGRRTYRVFDNVINNILKYAMANTRVYIDAEERDKEISFIFKNISAYEMNFDSSEITERFTRGDKSRNTDGSGLGLAIAKSLVELQNGSLNISIDGDLFKLIVTFPKKE